MKQIMTGHGNELSITSVLLCMHSMSCAPVTTDELNVKREVL